MNIPLKYIKNIIDKDIKFDVSLVFETRSILICIVFVEDGSNIIRSIPAKYESIVINMCNEIIQTIVDTGLLEEMVFAPLNMASVHKIENYLYNYEKQLEVVKKMTLKDLLVQKLCSYQDYYRYKWNFK